MAAWPASLPQELVRDGLRVSPGANSVEFDPELGPSMTRKRGSSAPTSVSGSMIVSQAQYATFLTFFETTTNHGADTFTWEHPIDDSAVTMRFDGPPQFSAVGAGFWQLDLSLIILP